MREYINSSYQREQLLTVFLLSKMAISLKHSPDEYVEVEKEKQSEATALIIGARGSSDIVLNFTDPHQVMVENVLYKESGFSEIAYYKEESGHAIAYHKREIEGTQQYVSYRTLMEGNMGVDRPGYRVTGFSLSELICVGYKVFLLRKSHTDIEEVKALLKQDKKIARWLSNKKEMIYSKGVNINERNVYEYAMRDMSIEKQDVPIKKIRKIKKKNFAEWLREGLINVREKAKRFAPL